MIMQIEITMVAYDCHLNFPDNSIKKIIYVEVK